MIRSSLCDYSDAYTLFKGTIIVLDTVAADSVVNNANKKVVLKNCITEIKNTQVHYAEDIDIAMPMYN